jgi:hypothetical protein
MGSDPSAGLFSPMSAETTLLVLSLLKLLLLERFIHVSEKIKVSGTHILIQWKVVGVQRFTTATLLEGFGIAGCLWDHALPCNIIC